MIFVNVKICFKFVSSKQPFYMLYLDGIFTNDLLVLPDDLIAPMS